MSQPLPPAAFAEALRHRQKVKRNLRMIIGGVVAFFVLLLGVGSYALFASPWLAARQVNVTGVRLLTVDEVTQAAQVAVGTPLLRQDLAGITARVSALPQVSDVSVTTSFPDTVNLMVTERSLVYQRTVDGQVEWVDADGVVFQRTAEPMADVIQVTAPNADERLLRDIATVVTNIPDSTLLEISALKAVAVDRIELTLSDKRTVVWGSAEESELKGQVLAALLSSVDARVYDISAPRQPTTKK